ncbi:MAG: hypothetical protein PHI12_05170 [Dehalococcoidales bacterium]|nr:hypothetical protein [Dehalococcoidales bacterium]
MINQQFGNQMESFKQMAQQSGVSGIAYIDSNPAEGFLRIKLTVTPAASQVQMIGSFATVLAQVSQMFGLQVKMRQNEDK